MRWVRIIFLLMVVAIFGAFLHYTLPQRDVVRIVEAERDPTEISGWSRFFFAQPDSGTEGQSLTRNVRYIRAVFPNGTPMEYRNEDTGLFGWPPYFKVDSDPVQTLAQDLASTREEPIWVAVTHYGWRNNYFSIYPNALSIRQVDGPDVTLIPWMPILILLVLAVILFMVWRIWERFEDRVILPMVDAASVRWAKMKDRLSGRG